jgi:LmbE family N-acetylglucosaminyl deacetylase
LGGTLAKYVSLGHRVTMTVATNGEVGSMTLPKEEIATVRKAEAAAAADVIGVDFVWVGYADEFL